MKASDGGGTLVFGTSTKSRMEGLNVASGEKLGKTSSDSCMVVGVFKKRFSKGVASYVCAFLRVNLSLCM